MGARELKVFQEIKQKQLLKGVALQVYEIIANSHGLTVGEIAWKYTGSGQDETALGRSRNELAKRVSDLVSLGAIKAYGRVLCPYTGRKANRYVVTGLLPQKSTTDPKIVDLNKSMVLKPEQFVALVQVRYACRALAKRWFIPSSLKLRLTEVADLIDVVAGVKP